MLVVTGCHAPRESDPWSRGGSGSRRDHGQKERDNWRQNERQTQRQLRGRAESCGGVVQGLNGTIESPGFPHGYPNYANCTWLIITGERNRIQLTFVTLALEEDFDIVSVYDGQPSPGNLKMRILLVTGGKC
ncbi:hypothetical protein PAMP_000636 [Pampus punctatissimus]